MAIHSVYVPIPPEQANRRLKAVDCAQFGFHLEAIPAIGGCVVAAVPYATAPKSRPDFLVSAFRRRSFAKRVSEALRSIAPEPLGSPAV